MPSIYLDHALGISWQARLVASICENVRNPQRQNPRVLGQNGNKSELHLRH